MVLPTELSVEASSNAVVVPTMGGCETPTKDIGILMAQALFKSPSVSSTLSEPVAVPMGIPSVVVATVSVGLAVYMPQPKKPPSSGPGVELAMPVGRLRFGLGKFSQLEVEVMSAVAPAVRGAMVSTAG